MEKGWYTLYDSHSYLVEYYTRSFAEDERIGSTIDKYRRDLLWLCEFLTVGKILEKAPYEAERSTSENNTMPVLLSTAYSHF